jgi:hypothetical protein
MESAEKARFDNLSDIRDHSNLYLHDCTRIPGHRPREDHLGMSQFAISVEHLESSKYVCD